MKRENSAFVASVAQAGSVLFNTPRTLEKLADLAAASHAAGASLAIFPEAFVGGYPKEMQFGTSFGVGRPKGETNSMLTLKVQLISLALNWTSSRK